MDDGASMTADGARDGLDLAGLNAPGGLQVVDGPPPQAMTGGVDWRVSDGLTAYPDALATMQARVAAIQAGTAPELVWLVEHPPLYTAGTSARVEELTDPNRFP